MTSMCVRAHICLSVVPVVSSVNDPLRTNLGMFVHMIQGRYVESSGPLLFHLLECELVTSLQSFPPGLIFVSVNNEGC